MQLSATVLVADLVGWSDVARKLEQNLGVDAVTRLNSQVRAFVEEAFAATLPGADRPPTEYQGDGVTVIFNTPAAAHDFGLALTRAGDTHNASRSEPDAKRVFRIGVATGELDRTEGAGGLSFDGYTRAVAVRLCAAAEPGHMLVDRRTFEGLVSPAQNLYLAEETVRGKRDERFAARRCLAGGGRSIPPAPTTSRSQRSWRSMAAVAALAVVAVPVVVWLIGPRSTQPPIPAPGAVSVGDGNAGNVIVVPGTNVTINQQSPPVGKAERPENEYLTEHNGAGTLLMKEPDFKAWIGAAVGGEAASALGRMHNGTRVKVLEQRAASPDSPPWGRAEVLDGPLKGYTGWVLLADLKR